MNPSLLAQLSPDRAPPPLGWWPLAPGWWGLMLLLLMATVAGLWLHKRRAPPSVRRGQRAALRELAQLQAAARIAPPADAQLARDVQQLLRRYAVVRYGREAVAALTGDAWIAFVVRHGGSAWSGDSGRALLRCAYGPVAASAAAGAPSIHREHWLRGARGFIQCQQTRTVRA